MQNCKLDKFLGCKMKSVSVQLECVSIHTDLFWMLMYFIAMNLTKINTNALLKNIENVCRIWGNRANRFEHEQKFAKIGGLKFPLSHLSASFNGEICFSVLGGLSVFPSQFCLKLVDCPCQSHEQGNSKGGRNFSFT